MEAWERNGIREEDKNLGQRKSIYSYIQGDLLRWISRITMNKSSIYRATKLNSKELLIY